MPRGKSIWGRPEQLTYLLTHTVIFAVGILITSVGTPEFVAIGTSIAATGMCGWVIFFYIRTTDQYNADTQRLRQLGVVTGFPGRSVTIRQEYEGRFRNAKRQIDWYGFGLRSLREDFLSEFPEWLGRAKIRILLVDPEAPSADFNYCDQRDLEEGNARGTIRTDVHQFVQSTVHLKNRFPDRFDIRLYRCMPSMNYCRIDSELFWGPYLIGSQSRNNPTFLTEKAGTLFEVYAEHFERMWADGQFSRPAFVDIGSGQFEAALQTRRAVAAAIEQPSKPVKRWAGLFAR